jgi:hypothetical protein
MTVRRQLLQIATAAAAAAALGPPTGVEAGKFVTVIESHPTPVIGRELAASFGVLGGFETGNVIKENGTYHMFYGEKASATTYPWKMGWTTQIGHWVAPKAAGPWTRLETVLSEGMWSTMPWYDEAASRWKIFYCNETDRTTRTATASESGRDSINAAQNWTWTDKEHAPSPDTYSISNPWQTADGRYQVFLDWGQFGVSLAWSDAIEGPYVVSPPTNTNTTTLINNSRLAVNSAHAWIENPVVTKIPAAPTAPITNDAGGGGGSAAGRGGAKYAAMFDWVQGGGEPAGSRLPYLGFSWSSDGKSWPAEHGELVSVVPSTTTAAAAAAAAAATTSSSYDTNSGDLIAGEQHGQGQHGHHHDDEKSKSKSKSKFWTELVRTPTSLIPEGDGTYTIFYAARDTSNASAYTGNSTQPFTNCSVPPHPARTLLQQQQHNRPRHAEQQGAGAGAGAGVAVGGGSAPPPPPPGWSDGCFWGMGMLRVKLNLDEE